MFHVTTFCDACGNEIVGEDYDERHWGEDGCTEYHAWCCPDCDHDDLEYERLMAEQDECDWVSQEIMNKEEQ